MIEGYVVVRQENHVDDRIIVCLKKDDAMAIANEMAEFWVQNSGRNADWPIDRTLYGKKLFHMHIDDGPRVSVEPTIIREAGETAKPEGQR